MTTDRHWTTVVTEFDADTGSDRVAMECSCGASVEIQERATRDRKVSNAHKIARDHRQNPEKRIREWS